ncbi:LysR family transcriptional regulator [Vibrio mexicanus]|uniref:LysR family transcriptional regulator n=1 Tax=Vibrio mexicanus TaxID=1004326 RepID=UPI00063CC74C|nr:LysR family transcriptional regulator [Vibrio mexicanus]
MNGAIFNQLRIFQAIVAEGNITNAAKRLQMAPPSVSNALKSLEEDVGLPLFTRTTRSIEVTEAGKRLYDDISTSMSELAFAYESISDLGKVPSGKVRLTIPRFVYVHYFQPVYAEFCQRYPNIELEVSISDANVDILNQGFDMGIRFGDRVEEGMVARRLTGAMHEALFATPDYLEAFGTPKTPDDLKSHKLIQYRFIASNQVAPLFLRGVASDITVEMPTALVVNDTDVMIDASLKGLGIGRIVEPVVADLIASGELIPVLQDYWYPYSELYVYFHKNAQKARRVRVMVDFLLEKFS